MTIIEIENLIEARKKTLLEEMNKDPVDQFGFNYCKEYTKDCPVRNANDFAKLDIWRCLECLYFTIAYETAKEENKKSPEFKKIKKDFDSIKNLFDNFDSNNMYSFTKLVFELGNNGLLEYLINYLEETNVIKARKTLRQITDNKYLIDIINDFKKLKDKEGCNIIVLFKMMEEEPAASNELFSLLYAHIEMNEEKEKFYEGFEKFNITARDKTKKKFLNDYLKEDYEINEIINTIGKINNFVYEKEHDDLKRQKTVTKEIKGLETSLKLLKESLEKEEITNITSIVKTIQNDIIKLAIIKLIYEHNMKYYSRLENEMNELSKNSKVKYQAVLNEIGISKDNYNVESIMHNSVEDIEKIISIISKYNLKEKEILKILQNSNLEIVTKIKELIEKGYLNIDFISNNIDIYYANSPKFQLFLKNIDILDDYNINPYNFRYSLNVLFENSNNLKTNLAILNNYNLLKNLKTTNNYQFLLFDNLDIRIDKIIELGYESYLEENLAILNSNNLKRLELIKALNIPIDSCEELLNVLNSNKFFIKDEDLDKYIPSTSNIPNISLNISNDELDSYRKTTRAYNFNGVLISINKVKRLLLENKKLEEAIFSNTTLSNEEYDNIMNLIGTNTK
jgi:hypothetical protein